MEIINTGDAPQSSLYSQAVKAAGLVFVSGQAPIDPPARQGAKHPVSALTIPGLKLSISVVAEA